ncbi:HTH-type transcriptional regulator GltR [compost metagenome]
MMSSNTPILGEWLRKGELDLALCAMPEQNEGLYFEPLYREPFVALVPKGHSLAKLEIVELEDLKNHRLLVTSANCPYRRKLEFLMAQSALPSPEMMEIGSMTALSAYVASGLGVALVPAILAEALRENVVSRLLKGSSVDMTCGLLSRTTEAPLAPASAKLYTELREALGN